MRFALACNIASRVLGAPGTAVPTAFRAIRAWEIRSFRRARSSEIEVGEGTSGAGEDITGIEGEREMGWPGEGEVLMPFVITGFLMAVDVPFVVGFGGS